MSSERGACWLIANETRGEKWRSQKLMEKWNIIYLVPQERKEKERGRKKGGGGDEIDTKSGKGQWYTTDASCKLTFQYLLLQKGVIIINRQDCGACDNVALLIIESAIIAPFIKSREKAVPDNEFSTTAFTL